MRESCEGSAVPCDRKEPVESTVIQFPINRLLSKAMLRPNQTPEYEAVQRIAMGRSLTGSRFWTIRCRLADWTDAGYGCLPTRLDRVPAYWDTPWLSKVRPRATAYDRLVRLFGFPGVAEDFSNIVSLTDRGSRFLGPPVPAVVLLGPAHERAAIYLDGNRRIAAAAYYGHTTVPIELRPDRCFTLQETYDAQGIHDYGGFTPADCARWFHHVFNRVNDASR